MINYKQITHAIIHYEKQGYEYIDVPWAVSKEAIDVTMPPQGGYFFLGNMIDKSLVGSAEQSYIQMMLDGTINGTGKKYVTATPCFRAERNITEITKPYFFKVELINYNPGNPDRALSFMVEWDVLTFYQKYFGYIRIQKVKTDEGFDIIDTKLNIELGSYGIREYKGHKWLYGTGLAEPRFSYCLAR
jgi:hypothetical protein